MMDCAICLSRDGFALKCIPTSKMFTRYYNCPVCGYFGIDDDLADDFLGPGSKSVTTMVRGRLSHWVRLNQNKSRDTLIVSDEQFRAALDGKLALPTPATAAISVLRYVGDHVQKTGDKLESVPPQFSAEIGTPTREAAIELIEQLANKGWLTTYNGTTMDRYDANDVGLTLEGWDAYEAEKKGQFSSSYGFIALETGDEKLESLVQNHLKPSLMNIGYGLVDYRDVSQAGVIDNILRVQIRDAAFVLVDLTHDNRGAYWEAGYAEGLGKPVLYICEKSKFLQASTHFDTNHCTTVQWDADNIPEFIANLTATLKRSLNI